MIINNKEDLITKISELRQSNIKIGTVSGSFDRFHEGHKFSLEFCMKNADKLLVLINSDKSISTYKGKNRPLDNIEKRIKALESFSSSEKEASKFLVTSPSTTGLDVPSLTG